MGADWIDRLAAGGKYTGFGLVAYSAVRLTVFFFNFFAGRYDARQMRLEALDKRVSESLGDRLEHLEQTGAHNQNRIMLLENAVAILLAELRLTDPSNSKLKEVANLLRAAIPVPIDGPFEDLLKQANKVKKS